MIDSSCVLQKIDGVEPDTSLVSTYIQCRQDNKVEGCPGPRILF
jgi:hypothetical protein